IGGDEFGILLAGIDTADDARLVAKRIQTELVRAFTIDGHELFVTVSIGISLGAPGIEPAELVRNADIAMYQAKRAGPAQCALFDESMHQRVVNRLARENDLHLALEQSLLTVHYQPIVDVATARLQPLEALARLPASL